MFFVSLLTKIIKSFHNIQARFECLVFVLESIGISICASAILGKWLIPLTQPLQYKEEFVSEFLLLVLIWKVTNLSCVP